MASQTLIFEPNDVLFFRDSRPFEAGENFRASSLFPPMSEPFVGAIRTAAIVRQGVSFQDYVDRKQTIGVEELYAQIGGPDRLGTLQIKGPFLVYCDDEPQVLLAAPADMVCHATTGTGYRCEPIVQEYCTTRPVRFDGAESSLRRVAVAGAVSGARVGLREGNFLTISGWLDYLRGLTVEQQEQVDASRLWTTELRTGIKLTDRRTSEDGMFYSIDTIRFADAEKIQQGQSTADRHQFAVMIDGLDESLLSDTGATQHVALGGQRRTASVEPALTDSPVYMQLVRLAESESIVRAIASGKSLRLCLITPAIFEQGSLPDFLKLDKENGSLATRLAGVDLRLVAAVTPKPIRIGGWSYAKRSPKAIRQAVPAGSVYYFEKQDATPFSNEEAKRLCELLHFQSLCRSWRADGQPLTDTGKRGLGICLLGT